MNVKSYLSIMVRECTGGGGGGETSGEFCGEFLKRERKREKPNEEEKKSGGGEGPSPREVNADWKFA